MTLSLLDSAHLCRVQKFALLTSSSALRASPIVPESAFSSGNEKWPLSKMQMLT